MSEGDRVLLFCPLDDLIHRIETILDLLHQPTLSFQTLSLIILHLVEQVYQLLLKGILGLTEIAHSVADLIINFAFDLCHHRPYHNLGILTIGTSILDQSSLLFIEVGKYLHHALALLIDLFCQVHFHRPQLLSHVDLAALVVLLDLLALLSFQLELVAQKGNLGGLLNAHVVGVTGSALISRDEGLRVTSRLAAGGNPLLSLLREYLAVHFDLLKRLCNLILHLCIPNCHLLQLICQLCLSVFQRVSSPNRRLLHRLEFETDIFDQLLLF